MEEEYVRKYLYRIISIGNFLDYHTCFELDNCLSPLTMNVLPIHTANRLTVNSEMRSSVRLWVCILSSISIQYHTAVDTFTQMVSLSFESCSFGCLDDRALSLELIS